MLSPRTCPESRAAAPAPHPLRFSQRESLLLLAVQILSLAADNDASHRSFGKLLAPIGTEGKDNFPPLAFGQHPGRRASRLKCPANIKFVTRAETEDQQACGTQTVRPQDHRRFAGLSTDVFTAYQSRKQTFRGPVNLGRGAGQRRIRIHADDDGVDLGLGQTAFKQGESRHRIRSHRVGWVSMLTLVRGAILLLQRRLP